MAKLEMSRLLLMFHLALAASFVNAGNNRTFPDGFLFGVATAAYQIEGAWNVDGKGENIWDHLVHTNASFIKNGDNGDVACDSYHRYKEDVALASGLGAKFYRFSISWSRILPTGFADNLNLKGITYYQNLIREILAHKMIPVATLYHWDLPQPLQDIGGWNNVDMVKHFKAYARVAIQHLQGVQYWATFNEPRQVCREGYGIGTRAPALKLDGAGDYLCAYVLIKAHAAAYHMYKTEFPDSAAKMSIVIDGEWSEPATNATADVEAAERSNQFEYGLYANPIYKGDWPQVVKDRVKLRSKGENLTKSRLPEFTQEEVDYINGTFDYMGFNTYAASLVADVDEAAFGRPSYDKDMRVALSTDPSWKTGSNGNAIVPWGVRKYLRWLKHTYDNPEIFISENGIADNGTSLADDDRIHFYADYLDAILDAMYEDGVRVIAYTAWSLLDNFEWEDGYTQHFGFYHINFTDPNRTRTAKKSVDFYRAVATTLQIPVVRSNTTETTVPAGTTASTHANSSTATSKATDTTRTTSSKTT